MNYFIICPSGCGFLGDETILDINTDPPGVKYLHLELYSPPLDDVFEVHPCYFVSDQLGQLISDIGLTGVSLVGMTDFKVEMEEQYREMHPDEPPPKIFWLKVVGRVQETDFGLSPDGRLIVSESALSAFRKFRINECDIYEFGTSNTPTSEQISDDIWERARKKVEEIRRSVERGDSGDTSDT